MASATPTDVKHDRGLSTRVSERMALEEMLATC
jgi:hypothetical protein